MNNNNNKKISNNVSYICCKVQFNNIIIFFVKKVRSGPTKKKIDTKFSWKKVKNILKGP